MEKKVGNDWITNGYLEEVYSLKEKWRRMAAQQTETTRWCHACQAEREFKETEAAWECTDCGTCAYWKDIEKLKMIWRESELDDWYLENDAGMGPWREELREFRLSMELERARRGRKRLENELHRYRAFIGVAREILTPLK